MAENNELKEQIWKIVDNQMECNTPPETNQHYSRLTELGYEANEAKNLIGQCLAVELFGVFKHGAGFDEKRYIENMTNLPTPPKE